MSDPPKAKIRERDDGLFEIGVLMPALGPGGEPVYCVLNENEDNPLAGCFMSRELAQAAIDKGLGDA